MISGLLEVKRDDLLAAGGILPQEAHPVALTVDRQVTCVGERLEDIHFAVCCGEKSGVLYFPR